MFEFVIYSDASGRFRYKMVAKNHEKLGDNYNTIQSAKDTVKLIKGGAADAKVFIETEDGSREEIML